MTRLFTIHEVDELTPVQYVGVYPLHWRANWGVPTVMFAEVGDPVYGAAKELLEACKALLEAFEGYEMLAALDATVQEQARAAINKAEPAQ